MDSNYSKAYGQSNQPYLNRYLRHEAEVPSETEARSEAAMDENPYETLDSWDDSAEDFQTDGSDIFVDDPQGLEGTSISNTEAETRIEALWQWLRQGSHTGQLRSEWAGQIKELSSLLKTSSASTLTGEAQALLQELEAKAFGTQFSSDQMAGYDPFGVDTLMVDGDGGTGTDGTQLLETLKSLRQEVSQNPNLSEADQNNYLEKIDRFISNLELGQSEETIDEIQGELETLRSDLAQASNHGPAVSRLAKATGSDPSVIQSLMEKHGIDPKNLPNRPDSKIAALLSDPELSENFSQKLDGLQSTLTNYQAEIDNQILAANNINAANEASDTSKVDTQSFTAHRWLYNAHFHRDERSQEIIGMREAIASEAAGLLTALYGEDATALKGAEEAGMIQIGSSKLNVIPEGGGKTLNFSTDRPAWFPVELVPVFIDDEGDGKTRVVSWMREAHYPYHIYDTGGAVHSPSGNWSWNQTTVDIGRAV